MSVSIMSPFKHDPTSEYENCLQNAVNMIREMMMRKTRKYDTLEELIIIDVIQRLGLDHYFIDEIHAILERQYAKFRSCEESGGVSDLHEISLCFRLLRQERYNVSPDIFKKFMNEDGKFKKEHDKDVKGLMGLFEASQLSIQGEDILEEATAFSGQLLKATLFDITEQPKSSIIGNTLKNPYHKSLTMRFLEKNFLFFDFLQDFVDARDWINGLINLAKIDFEMAQMSWKRELLQVSIWGEALNLDKKLEFARIRPIEWYMWSVGTLPWPNMAEERIELCKVLSFIFIIDDVFDIHGTFDELSLFTQVVNRWEHSNIELLPEYMKVCIKVLYEYTDDFSLKIYRKYGWNPKSSIVNMWIDLCNSFFAEAKWFASGKLPKCEEYLKNAIVTCGIPVYLMHAFFLLGEGVNKKNVDEMNSLQPVVCSVGRVLRLWNDVGTNKDPNRDGNDWSYIDCYMNEHKKCSAESARRHVNQMIRDAWMCLNQEWLSPTSPFSVNFRVAILNLASMVRIMYDRDAQSHRRNIEKLLNWLLTN